VLVVADQLPLRVGGERRLARAGEAEEDRDVAVLADVGGAVHRQHALERQRVVQEREDALLDLAGVVGAADHDLALGRVEDAEGAGARAVLLRVGLEARRVQDDRRRAEALELVRLRRDEHRPGEERVVRHAGDHAQRDPVARVRAGEGVDDVEVVALAQVVADLAAQRLVVLLGERVVDVAPPDPLLGLRLDDRELVLGRAAGEGAGVDDERPAVGDAGLAAQDGVLVEHRRGRVPQDAPGRRDAVLGEIDSALPLRCDRHAGDSFPGGDRKESARRGARSGDQS
jgi:hypothetical protein